MRIMHISTRLILGGSQENTLLSCMTAADCGHEVALAFGPIFGPEGSLLPCARADPRIELIEVPDLVREISPLRDAKCLSQLRRIIRQWKPDVVHTHSSKAGILGRAAAWKERVKVIVHTIHGMPFHPYQSRILNELYIRLERWGAHRCHAIVSVGDSMTRQALAQHIGRPSQFVTIRSPIDTRPYLEAPLRRAELRARFGWDDSVVVLGTVSRLAQLKGHDDLLDACDELLRASADKKLALLWVGDGWWRDRLEERIRLMGLTERVALTGLVDPREIPAWISAMDVVVHPSYREGVPRSVVQGLLCGKPVIAYDIDGAGEVIEHGKSGLLVAPGDKVALREAIDKLTRDPPMRASMGDHGRSVVSGQFDCRMIGTQLLDLYTKLGAAR